MAQLNYDALDMVYDHVPVAASQNIAEGAFVSMNNQYARNLNTSDQFGGVALRARDNSSGAAGDIEDLPILVRGVVRGLTVTGATATTAKGTLVYATDEDSLTLTASGGLLVGRVAKAVGTDEADVFFEAADRRSPA